jgi:Zn-dependent peptidase ImmA (M78 family)
MLKLKYGFKTDCEKYAKLFRNELGLKEADPLHSKALAEHLGIPLYRISELDSLSPQISLSLAKQTNQKFFAATIGDESFRAVVYNEFVALTRQNSDIMHELSHIIAGHPLYSSISADKQRIHDPIHEEEAKVLSFTLMIPRAVALRIVEEEITTLDATKIFHASPAAINYRIAKTDAKQWANNRRMKVMGG